MFRNFLPILALVSFFIPGLVFAQDNNLGKPLTSQRIENFIASLMKIRDIDRRHGGKGALENARNPGSKTWSPFSGAAQSVKSHPGKNDIMAAIRSGGFVDSQDWADTGTRIYRAYGAVKMGSQQPELAAKMAKARAQIEKSKMSPEQKKGILKMMEQQMGAIAAFQNVPEGDKAAVKPHLAALDTMNK